jgi:hypothetical protein
MKIKAICIASLMGTLSAGADAQELWRGANVADSPEQIMSAFPDARLLDEPIAYDNSEGLILLDNFEVGGETFDVRFLFSDRRLVSINMVVSQKDTGEVPYPHTFSQLELLLAKRYGEPVVQIPARPRDPGFLNVYENSFSEGDLTIKLSCWFCGDPKMGNLIVQYSEEAANQASEF